MSWRIGIVLALILGAGVMAYEIGSRLSDEAIMMIAGVSCGIVASIPVSLGLLIALTRDRTSYAADDTADLEPEPAPYTIYRPAAPQPPQVPQFPQQQPQIIVVAPPQSQLPPNFAPYGNYLSPPQLNALPAPMQERTFKIVGEDDED